MADDLDRWLGIELRHLAALAAVSQAQSFRGAATQLGYVPSAVSSQIATLERIVGRRLVERRPGGGRAELTEAGGVLLEHANRLIAQLRAAQADLERAPPVTVGICSAAGAALFAALVRSAAVELRPRDAADDLELYAELELGDVDLAFVGLPAPPGPFALEELLRDPYVALVPAAWPTETDALELDDLAELPLVATTRPRALARAEEQLRLLGVVPRVVARTDAVSTTAALVAAGVGAAIVPRNAAAFDADRVTEVELAPALPPSVTALARHRDRVLSPAAETAAALAREAARREDAQRRCATSAAIRSA